MPEDEEVHLEPYFELRGDIVVPRPHAASMWGANMISGRPLSGLMAWRAERDHGEEGWQPARLTVDMFRPAPLAPLVVTSARIRDGSRVRVCDVMVHNEGKLICRGSVLFINQGLDSNTGSDAHSEGSPDTDPGADPEKGTIWEPPMWDAPPPQDVAPDDAVDGHPIRHDMRHITGLSASGQRRVWMRESRDLVDGEKSTRFVKVASIADFVNALANSGSDGMNYINADVTLFIARLPESDWVGCEAVAHVHAAGVAVGGMALYDTGGRIGYSYVCGLRRDLPQRMMRA